MQDDRGSAVAKGQTARKQEDAMSRLRAAETPSDGMCSQLAAAKKKKPEATASGKSNGIVFQWEDVFLPAPRKHQLANSSKTKAFAGNT